MRRNRVLLLAVTLMTLLLGRWGFWLFIAEPEPPTPVLLRGVGAGGGYASACPPLRPDAKLALSPELNVRLLREFPPGTAEAHLLEELVKMGFSRPRACEGDSTTRSAFFQQHGGSLRHFAMAANVFWKVDDSGVLVWTKGFVSFDGY